MNLPSLMLTRCCKSQIYRTLLLLFLHTFILHKDEEDEYQPENVTFAPKDVMPVDLTPKENVHGLGYKGLDPSQALFGASGREHLNLFAADSEDPSSLIGDVRNNRQRKLGITGQVRYCFRYFISSVLKSKTYLEWEAPNHCRLIVRNRKCGVKTGLGVYLFPVV